MTGPLLVAILIRLVCRNNALHQRMADNVFLAEKREGDAVNIVEYAGRVVQTGLLACRQINLRDVSGYDRAGTEADTCQKHLHLFDAGILCFVENNEGLV
jgi:hypothetical protein